MTNSTVSSESAPRSSTKEAVGVTSPSSTPSCSTIICFTFSSTAAMFSLAQNLDGTAGAKGNPNRCCRLRSNEPALLEHENLGDDFSLWSYARLNPGSTNED